MLEEDEEEEEGEWKQETNFQAEIPLEYVEAFKLWGLRWVASVLKLHTDFVTGMAVYLRRPMRHTSVVCN